MAKQWLNPFTDQNGISPASGAVTVTTAVETLGWTVNLFETDRSGGVHLAGEGSSYYGDPEVYLNLIFTDGTSRYLSAPFAYSD